MKKFLISFVSFGLLLNISPFALGTALQNEEFVREAAFNEPVLEDEGIYPQEPLVDALQVKTIAQEYDDMGEIEPGREAIEPEELSPVAMDDPNYLSELEPSDPVMPIATVFSAESPSVDRKIIPNNGNITLASSLAHGSRGSLILGDSILLNNNTLRVQGEGNLNPSITASVINNGMVEIAQISDASGINLDFSSGNGSVVFSQVTSPINSLILRDNTQQNIGSPDSEIIPIGSLQVTEDSTLTNLSGVAVQIHSGNVQGRLETNGITILG